MCIIRIICAIIHKDHIKDYKHVIEYYMNEINVQCTKRFYTDSLNDF